MPYTRGPGAVSNGLCTTPDGRFLVYPVGCNVLVRSMDGSQQIFLSGHTDRVSAVAMSRDGKRLASGQVTHLGFKVRFVRSAFRVGTRVIIARTFSRALQAPVMVWDLEATIEHMEAKPLHTLSLHKGGVQALEFSPSGRYLATLGARDDNNLAIWDTESGEPICGSPAASELALCMAWYSASGDTKLVTGGHLHVRLWDFDREKRKVRTPEASRPHGTLSPRSQVLPTNCILGQLRRVVTSVALDARDRHIFCATTSGDILKLHGHNGRFISTSTKRYEKGVRSMCVVNDEESKSDGNVLLVGGGAGAFALNTSTGTSPIAERKCVRALVVCTPPPPP